MVDRRQDGRRNGPAERAAALVPPPSGRGFRFVVVSLLAISTVALVVVAVELFLLLGRAEPGGDRAAVAGDLASLKTEVAGLRADTAKAMATLAKTAAEISDRVNTTNLTLNNLALGLAKKP